MEVLQLQASIVLLAIVDAKYHFTFANVGCLGMISDGGVFKNTSFYKKDIGNELGIPEETLLPGQDIPMPYILVGDDALPLLNNILKPFSEHHPKGSIERKSNYRVSRAGL